MLPTVLADTSSSVCFTSVSIISTVRLRRAILRFSGGLALYGVLRVNVGGVFTLPVAGVSFTEMSTTLGDSVSEMSTTVASVTDVSTAVVSVAGSDAAELYRSVGEVESIYWSIGPVMGIGLTSFSTAVCRVCVRESESECECEACDEGECDGGSPATEDMSERGR